MWYENYPNFRCIQIFIDDFYNIFTTSIMGETKTHGKKKRVSLGRFSISQLLGDLM